MYFHLRDVRIPLYEEICEAPLYEETFKSPLYEETFVHIIKKNLELLGGSSSKLLGDAEESSRNTSRSFLSRNKHVL